MEMLPRFRSTERRKSALVEGNQSKEGAKFLALESQVIASITMGSFLPSLFKPSTPAEP
jgi:hypothetical protein